MLILRNNLNLVTGELVNPSVNLPIAVTLGPFLVIVCYLLANVSLILFLFSLQSFPLN